MKSDRRIKNPYKDSTLMSFLLDAYNEEKSRICSEKRIPSKTRKIKINVNMEGVNIRKSFRIIDCIAQI